MRLCFTLLFVGVLLNLLGASSPPVLAARGSDDLAELIKDYAEAVAEIEVTDIEYGEDSELGTPVTILNLAVKKVYKGDLTEGRQAQAEYLGGFKNGQQTVVAEQPSIPPRSHAILLLSRFGGKTKNWRIVGGTLGHIAITSDGNGQLVAKRAEGKFEYYVPNPESLTGFTGVTVRSLPLEQLGRLLESIVRTGRPVLEEPAAPAAPADPARPVAQPAAAPVPAGPPKGGFFGPGLMVLAVVVLGWLVLRQTRRG